MSMSSGWIGEHEVGMVVIIIVVVMVMNVILVLYCIVLWLLL